ncbi:MAG: hypothetical protein ACYTAO_07230 [Planctomycetota bacterium]|jgi:hypothetical protein
MMPGNLFRLELASAFAGPRRTALRIGLTILLGLPFVLVDMPVRAQAAGIMMVILFTSFFGAAVGHAKLLADQRWARLILLPTSRPLLWLDLVLASVLARLLPTATVLTFYLLVNARSVTVGALTGLLGLLCASVVLLTLLGIATGKLARNNQEVHLFGALAVVILACICGITPLPQRLAGVVAAMAWNPVAQLNVVLTGVANGSAPARSAELVLATLVLVGFMATAVLRWIAGRTHKNAQERES